MFYTVGLINMGYSLNEQFSTLESAKAAAKWTGFECAIRDSAGVRVVCYSPISGFVREL